MNSSVYLFFPPLPLEVGHLFKIQLGGPRERWKFLQRCLGRSPSRNRIWCN